MKSRPSRFHEWILRRWHHGDMTKSPRRDAGGKGAAAVRTKRVPLSDLKPAPYNPRTITASALSGLGASIDRFGLVQPIIVNERTGYVVGGHQRAKALEARGVVETDVVLVDLPEDEEKALNVALNSGAISGDWTPAALPLLAEIQAALPDLAAELKLPDLGADLAKLFPPPPVEIEEDEVPEPPADPVTKPGDVWVLGRHRLVCGDSTVATDVERAFGGAEPFIMVTDPPYGVEYEPDWRNHAERADGTVLGASAVGTVQNDARADWTEAWALFPGDVAYVWHGALHASVVAQNLLDAGYDIRGQIIWKKARFAISRGAYHWGHEPAWYAVRKGRTARWCGDRKQSTVWDITHVANETGHGTQKPVECMARPIRNHGAPGDTVYDPFLGSGTTIVAAEQLDRSCVGLEIDPAYCDVIVERWQNLTGGKAKRE